MYVANGLPKSEENKDVPAPAASGKKSKKRTLNVTLTLKFKKYIFDEKSTNVAQTT